ncbi:hypothetical protein HK100_000420, partial [Physocladia obscura]
MSTPPSATTESDPYAQYGGYEAYMAAWAQYYASAGASGAEQGQQDNNAAGGSASGSGLVNGTAYNSNNNSSSRGDRQYSGGGGQYSRSSHSATASSTNNIPLGVRNSAGPSSVASAPSVPSGKSEDTIYINGLPPSVTVAAIAEYFGTVGIIKTDKKLRPPGPKIWIYRDKATQLPKGDATLTYEDPPAASAAITFFNGKPFRGGSGEPLLVQLADAPAGAVKFAESGGNDRRGGFGGRGGGRGGGGSGGYGRGGGGGGGGGGLGGAEGDWECPSCSNKNFARRFECNRCQTPRPAGLGDSGSSGGGGGGGGRGAPPARDGDWECGSCGNKNFARRHECNKCQAPKPRDANGGGGGESRPYGDRDWSGGRGGGDSSGRGRGGHGGSGGAHDNGGGGRGDYGGGRGGDSRGGGGGYGDRRRDDHADDRRDR